jgi:Copper fist DNA binding domain
MLVKNLLMTCWSCLNGHRVSNCHHPTRPLYALKNKGRPRPQTLSRSKDNPDVMSIDDPGFTLFHEYIMNDPILCKEYFHADEVKSPKKRAAAPYAVKRGRSRSVGSTVDIYAGKCSAEEVFRWRELCGVVGVSFNGNGTNFWMPVWPTTGSMPMTSCPTMNTSPVSTINLSSVSTTITLPVSTMNGSPVSMMNTSPISAMKTGLTNTDNVVSLMNTMTTENVLDNNILSPSPEAFNHSGLFNRATSFSPGTFNKHIPILDYYTQLNINTPCQPDDLSLNSPIIPLDNPSFVESQLSFKEAENLRSEFLLPSPWESELDSPLSTTDTSLFTELFGDDMEIPSDMAMKLDTNEFNLFYGF